MNDKEIEELSDKLMREAKHSMYAFYFVFSWVVIYWAWR